jgi:hypothetical protein
VIDFRAFKKEYQRRHDPACRIKYANFKKFHKWRDQVFISLNLQQSIKVESLYFSFSSQKLLGEERRSLVE